MTQSALRFIAIASVVHIIHLSMPCTLERFAKHHRISFEAHREYLKKNGPTPTSVIVEVREHERARGDNSGTKNDAKENAKRQNNRKGICFKWLIHGVRCQDNCEYRHRINASDFPSRRYAPNSQVRFRISDYHSPVHYEIVIQGRRRRRARDGKPIHLIIGGYVPHGSAEWIKSRRFVLTAGPEGRYKANVLLHMGGIIVVDDVIETTISNGNSTMDTAAPVSLLKKIMNRQLVLENNDGLAALAKEMSMNTL